MVAEELLLPPGSRLLHIGPHKTGTTALQSAFHAHRRELAAQGVRYAGPNRQPMQAAHAITGRASPYADGKTPSKKRWEELAREVARASEPRVVISSEGFADANDEGARRVVADLGGDQVHVVITLRSLVNILPSQWQQYIQGGLTHGYPAWLDAMFNKPPGTTSPSFWHRHRHDQLVARWAAAADPSRVTVVVADEVDRHHVLRVFEELTGLRAGTLVPEPDLGNRSLTLAEVETVRNFNIAFRAEGLGTQLHNKVMRLGAAEWLKRRAPAADEPRIETPAWAVERAEAVGREIVDGIRASGVRVVGDLDALAPAPKAKPRSKRGPAKPDTALAEAGTTDGTGSGDGSQVAAEPRTADATWAKVGANTAVGILLASGLARGAAAKAGADKSWPDGPPPAGPPPPRARVEPIELARISTPLLAVIVFRRLVGDLVARLTPWRHRS